jgi:integrase
LPSDTSFAAALASIVAHQKGVDPASFQSIADVLDPEAIDNAINFITKRAGSDKTGDIYRVMRTIVMLGKHWARLPAAQLVELKNIRAAVYPGDGPADKTIELLKKFRDSRLQEAFLLGPERVMARLKRKRYRSRKDAVDAQVAALWAVMTAAPVRSHNAVALCEGVNYVRFGSGRHTTARIHFPADQVKNDRGVNLLVPRDADELVRVYMTQFHPLLGSDTPGQLCPARGHAAKKASLLSSQLARMTSNVLGLRMTAHQWRHVVGYIFLTNNPGCYEPVRRLLGHRSIDTTARYYAFLLDEDAQEIIDATFEKIRQSGRQRLRRRSSR